MEKVCKKCGLKKDINSFHLDNRAKDKHHYFCKICRSKNNKKVDWNKKENKRIARKIWNTLYRRIKVYLKKGHKKSFFDETVGCSVEFYIKYIEEKFKENMSWKNYGKNGWEFDHVKPQSSFDLTNQEEIKKCYNYTNTQPLWKKENSKKNARGQ